MVGGRLLVISSVRDEAAHIEQVVAGVAGQERPPDRWLIVDAGSSDGTPELAARLVADLPYATVLRAPDGDPAGGARAWNDALGQADDFEFVANLDGDVVLPPYYLAAVLQRFREQPHLGAGGGAVTVRRNGSWWTLPVLKDQPTEPARVYRRTFLEAIGGAPQHAGADVAVVYARMLGFTTRTFRDLPVRQLQSLGGDHGLRGRVEHEGRRDYVLHCGLPRTVARAVHVAVTRRPYGRSGLWYLVGYLRARFGEAEPAPDPELAAFARRERRQSARARLRRLLP
jgi:glycosyltransferase involved in cell wall biosynthesis